MTRLNVKGLRRIKKNLGRSEDAQKEYSAFLTIDAATSVTAFNFFANVIG